MKLRVLIADDEPPARANLAHLLRLEAPQAEVREAENGLTTGQLLRDWQPNLLFLDVQMPGLGGLDLMRVLPEANRPVTVFVTAHREFAVEAFEVEALDYLVKPFRRERFVETLRRALARIEDRAGSGSTPASVTRIAAEGGRGRGQLRFKDGNRTLFLAIDDLRWASAAGNYVEVHTALDKHLIRTTMKRLERALADERFVRIHRGTLVNREAIREIRTTDHGDFLIRLTSGEQLTMSRHRKLAVQELWGSD